MTTTQTRQPVTETSRAYRQELVSRAFTEADTPPAPEAETMTENSLTAEEIAALISDAPAATPEAFCPTDAAGVDWVLGKVAAARAEALLIRTNMEAMARACERKAEALEWKYGGAIQTYLQAETEGGKKKSVRLPHGVIGYRTKPAGVQVTDPAALLAWTKANFPAAVVEALDKKVLATWLLESGEAADGARLSPAEEVFYIK